MTDLRFSSVSGKVREIAKTLRPCPTFEPAADSRDLHDLHDLHVLTCRSKWEGYPVPISRPDSPVNKYFIHSGFGP